MLNVKVLTKSLLMISVLSNFSLVHAMELPENERMRTQRSHYQLKEGEYIKTTKGEACFSVGSLESFCANPDFFFEPTSKASYRCFKTHRDSPPQEDFKTLLVGHADKYTNALVFKHDSKNRIFWWALFSEKDYKKGYKRDYKAHL
jgi:hypothetical protein